VREAHNKLVRDRIPEIIRASGGDYAAETMTAEEFEHALRAKLVEEAREAAAAPPAELLSELADLCEVVEALAAVHGITPEALRGEQHRRRLERGGFDDRILLLWSARAD
jgi:predicted house-cleaning noncanonical NTP pyrophosphatase (MazG superfamily)